MGAKTGEITTFDYEITHGIIEIMRFDIRRLHLLFLVLLIAIAVAVGIYFAEKLYFGPLRRQEQLVSNLKQIVEALTRDIRIAEVAVLDQSVDPTATTFRFVEVDQNRERIGEPKVFTIKGDVAYFDTLVIKFLDSYAPLKELPLKQDILDAHLANKAIIFFRRVFGEKQKPEDGFPLDTPGGIPKTYCPSQQVTVFEQNLWDEFWLLANDPKLANTRGVRAAHGQAVYTKLQPGKYYVLEQRLVGDLTIRPVDLPAVMR